MKPQQKLGRFKHFDYLLKLSLFEVHAWKVDVINK